jgi:hypothetical protein
MYAQFRENQNNIVTVAPLSKTTISPSDTLCKLFSGDFVVAVLLVRLVIIIIIIIYRIIVLIHDLILL